MKKIGIMLAALVITMFFVGAVAAMPAKNPPDQREKFIEVSAVQGVGKILYEKTILDKSIAVDVHEMMSGDTGLNGAFAMTIHEVLNEGVRLNCSGNCTIPGVANSGMGTINDPIYGDLTSPTMTNFECNKMVQFETDPDEYAFDHRYDYHTSDGVLVGGDVGLSGTATYNTPGFHGGINAKVTENFGLPVSAFGYVNVSGAWKWVDLQQAPMASLQKDETTTMTTTATFKETDPERDWKDCKKAEPYKSNELNFDTKNAFNGAWETQSSWKKVCSKNIQHHQRFIGEFQVDKNLIFKEEVTKPCPGKTVPHGDC